MFIPFLIISIGAIGIYTYLHWLLCIKTNIINTDQNIVIYFAPILFPGIPLLAGFRPLIKLLDTKAYIKYVKGGDSFGAYILFAWAGIAFPNVRAQEYLDTKTGQLTELNYISEIKTAPPTKYYKVRNFYIDKNLFRERWVYAIEGKHNQIYGMYLYIPCPFYDYNDTTEEKFPSDTTAEGRIIVANGRRIDRWQTLAIDPKRVKSLIFLKGPEAEAVYGKAAAKGAEVFQTYEPVDFNPPTLKRPDPNRKFTPAAWLGVKFDSDTSNKLTEKQKNSAFDQFVLKSKQTLAKERLDNFVYLERVGQGSLLKSYLKAINAPDYLKITQPAIVLSPVFEPYEARTGNKLPWAIGLFFIGFLFFLFSLVARPLEAQETEQPVQETEQPVKSRRKIRHIARRKK